jgi:hypothetical protein
LACFVLTEILSQAPIVKTQNIDVDCHTKHGRALLCILGSTDEVKQFDKARKQVKDCPEDPFHHERYNNISAVMQTKISRAERSFREQLKSWEHEHLTKTGVVSTTKDMLADPLAKRVLGQLKICKVLAKEWKKENV